MNSSAQAPTKATKIDQNAAVADAVAAGRIEQRAADDAAEHADDHGAEAAPLLGAGGHAGESAGEQADDDPAEDAHRPETLGD